MDLPALSFSVISHRKGIHTRENEGESTFICMCVMYVEGFYKNCVKVRVNTCMNMIVSVNKKQCLE